MRASKGVFFAGLCAMAHRVELLTVTKSRSAIQRSIKPFIAVSASVLAPWATPMALVISLDMSSKNLLPGCMGASIHVPAYMVRSAVRHKSGLTASGGLGRD
jgi:hypothetical protein